LGIAIYQLTHIAGQTPELLPKTSIVVGVTTMVCYFIAPLWPASASRCPVSSAAAALLLVPSEAPPVAFVAGSSDGCWGADLLHLADVRRIGAGMASIGGAGTFDGIGLSGIIAAYLA